MKIIISPAKKMKINTDILAVRNLPRFLNQTEQLLQYLKNLSYEEAKTLWNCNDSIATLNYERIQHMELKENLTPALLSYEGIQYQYMAPNVMAFDQWDYVQEHLYILSGFYGLVRPLDGVVPYRLEMQAKVQMPGIKNLYEYWGHALYDEVAAETDIILNLASKEYSKCIEKYLIDDIRLITCVFGEYKNDKIIEKGTYAKMARGEMVRFMAENKIDNLENLKEFNRLGFGYSEDFSEENTLTFVKEKQRDGRG